MGFFMTAIQSLLKRAERKVRTAPQTPNQDEQAAKKDKLHKSIEENFKIIKNAFGDSIDLHTGDIAIGSGKDIKIGLVYIHELSDKKVVQDMILNPLILKSTQIQHAVANEQEDKMNMIKSHIPALSPEEAHSFEDVYKSILVGLTIVLVEGYDTGLVANTIGGDKRSIEEPPTQSVVRGPRQGFTESFGVNVQLIRKIIRTPNLWLETMQIGQVTHTPVGVMYIHGIADVKLVEEIRTRLKRIEIDAILESNYIEELIQDETFTPFPTIYNSERPDVIAGELLEGRVAILVDGTPFVLIAPALFVQFFQSSEDYYQRSEFATLIRILRYICFFITLLAPSVYIAITTFHQEILPSTLLFSLAAQREGVPFPVFVEALAMEVTFEILREAGLRLPKTVGQAVSIVGALVIGQAAVEAGLVSPAMVIVVAITAISNFVIPSFSMGISLRIIRFALMVLAASFGLFGVIIGLIAMIQHLCSLRSFGVPYMSPLAPFALSGQKDTIFRMPQWALFSRPRFIGQKNRIRLDSPPPQKPEGN
jgi:spore germination protein KA